MTGSGETAAVKAQLTELLPRLRRFALSLTGSRDEADDLLQTALERALRRLDTWQRGTRLDSWMYRIIQNTRIDQARSERARPQQISIEQTAEAPASMMVESADESKRTLDRVLAAMEQLPEHHRLVLTLVCIEGMRYREAAEVLGVSIGTVMSRLARARVKLHELLNPVDLNAAGESP